MTTPWVHSHSTGTHDAKCDVKAKSKISPLRKSLNATCRTVCGLLKILTNGSEPIYFGGVPRTVRFTATVVVDSLAVVGVSVSVLSEIHRRATHARLSTTTATTSNAMTYSWFMSSVVWWQTVSLSGLTRVSIDGRRRESGATRCRRIGPTEFRVSFKGYDLWDSFTRLVSGLETVDCRLVINCNKIKCIFNTKLTITTVVVTVRVHRAELLYFYGVSTNV